MNHLVVVDASVAVKVVLEEEFSDRARALFASSRRDRRPVLGPPHLASEVTNAIYRKLRNQDITPTEAAQALTQFVGLPIHVFARPELYERAFDFARNNQLPTIYDSLYVVLAQLLSSELWTDDRELLRRVQSAAPWVRWIRDYQSS